MGTPIYTPIFRYRQEEKKVLSSFDFGDKIYPYIEIFKKLERKHTSKKKAEPEFHEAFLPFLKEIKSDRVFIDLPVHLKVLSRMDKEALVFLNSVVGKRESRTSHLLGLKALRSKIIPVITTFSQRTGEPNSIILQENDLRPDFIDLAFRTSILTFNNDIQQIAKVARSTDYLFIDLEEYCLSNDEDLDTVNFMFDYAKTFDLCNIIFINSAIHHQTTNSGLDHGNRIEKSDNSLQLNFRLWGGNGFADYAGIKKDLLTKGGVVSPGFIYYDAIENSYYGYKGLKRDKPKLEDFLDIIIPDVLKSDATTRMQNSTIQFLDSGNQGWKLINDMVSGIEPSKSQPKFKRISMLHYLHCIKRKIEAGIL
ncbi:MULTISPECIES: beta family protein [Sphingobacterium]|uniref:beta family protein n=1 Tax=Sphingobacterium TaxID=28453 RepID=UPI00257B3A27|nr:MULTISPECIES: hypothetical protein [Sphingobacterium]